LEEYRKECGENFKGMKASNINEVMNKVNDGMENFGASRHSGGKGDRFRQAMGDNLGSMKKCINGMAEIGAAAGAFPPAMPVGLIFTAASGLISVSRNRSRANPSTKVEVRDWIREVKYTNVLLPLARGHVQNWLNATDQVWILEKFRFAKAALLLVSQRPHPKISLTRYRWMTLNLTTPSHSWISEPSRRKEMSPLLVTRHSGLSERHCLTTPTESQTKCAKGD
jgi:hypothetical protein